MPLSQSMLTTVSAASVGIAKNPPQGFGWTENWVSRNPRNLAPPPLIMVWVAELANFVGDLSNLNWLFHIPLYP